MKTLSLLLVAFLLAGCRAALVVDTCVGEVCVKVQSDREYAEGYEFWYKDATREFRFTPNGAVTNNPNNVIAEKALDIVDRKIPDIDG